MIFEDFYALYPRKQSGAAGRIMWARLTDAEKTLAMEAIPKHVEMWEAESRDKCMIPLPASWLNPKLGRRWEDEISLPVEKKQVSQWWASEAGIISKANEVGKPPRPGESLFDLKNRLNEYLKKAGT